MDCNNCPFNRMCPCGYSCNNAACLTIRKQYADAMTSKSDALYDNSKRIKIKQPVDIGNLIDALLGLMRNERR